jgi:hypothetical protein
MDTFRGYLTGLPAPRDRNETLTALAGAEPVAGGAAPGGVAAAVLPVGVALGPGRGQRPQAGAAAGRPGDRAARRRVLVIDDSGDRNDGERGPAPAGPAQPPPSWPARSGPSAPGSPPWIALQRWWTAWSNAPPPRQPQDLKTSLQAGSGLHLYIPN